MTLPERIDKAIAEAMKARDQARLAPLRMLKTALLNRKVEKRRDLTELEALQVVSALVKQRHDSIEQFSAAGRDDLATKEAAEIAVLEQYLPPPVEAGAIDAAVEGAISETGATSTKDVGRVMKIVMQKLAGQTVDGRQVNELVRKRLGG